MRKLFEKQWTSAGLQPSAQRAAPAPAPEQAAELNRGVSAASEVARPTAGIAAMGAAPAEAPVAPCPAPGEELCRQPQFRKADRHFEHTSSEYSHPLY